MACSSNVVKENYVSFLSTSGCSFDEGDCPSDMSNSSKMDVIFKTEKGDCPPTSGHQPEKWDFPLMKRTVEN